VSLDELRETAAEIESLLRLQTYPIAIKMLKGEDEIPGDAKRPVRDFGYHLSACQAFAMSRREGVTVAELKEDMWCFEPVVGFGLAQAPDFFLEGNNRYPDSARTPEAGRTWAKAFPRLNVGEYAGVVSAPAKAAGFDPDLVMIYCNPGQLTQLLIVKNWMDGIDVSSRLSGHAACVYAVVPTLQTGEWAVTSPCRGDRSRALARDDEITISIPASALPLILEGMHHLRQHGWGLPYALSMRPEYALAPAYVRIGEMMGMPWLKK